MLAAFAHGLEPYLTVNDAPVWARLDEQEAGAPPNPDDLGKFMHAAAARYSGWLFLYSETVRGLRGDGRDERFRQLDLQATALAGGTVLAAIIVAFAVRGSNGSGSTNVFAAVQVPVTVADFKVSMPGDVTAGARWNMAWKVPTWPRHRALPWRRPGDARCSAA